MIIKRSYKILRVISTKVQHSREMYFFTLASSNGLMKKLGGLASL